MPNSPTPILGLSVPTVGGDSGIWGTELNTDLAILDFLGALAILSTAVNLTVPLSTAPETVILATAGAGGITITLPTPASCTGKVFTVKKVDSAIGAVTIQGGTIDGNSSYIRSNQYSYARLLSDGVNYDVIGGN